MHRPSRPVGLELLPRQMQRSQSVSSDRTSISTTPSLASPPPVSPDPAYIAASAASQIVTSDHQNQVEDWFDGNGGKDETDTIAVSPASLTLINGFLDQLLFSILAFARSTSIAALRPAVAEVLKPRLAKDAIDGADQELQEFLGGGDAEELSAFHHGQHQHRGKWDLGLVWRRTRLRCMVYTRLGDMEEEDEEMYIEQEHLEHATNGDRRISRELALVSPAAAIFLTSILEFIGEHALMVAGEAAANRMDIRQHRHEPNGSTATTEMPRLAVEDIDVEKLAFNTTLGRLWRSWKKRVRSANMSGSRPLSREMMRRRAASASASPSMSEVEDPSHVHETVSRPSVHEVLEEEQEAARTPRNSQSDDAPHDHEVPEPTSRPATGPGLRAGDRPQSMMVYGQPPTDSSGTPRISPSPSGHPQEIRKRPGYPERRKRSSSLPNLRTGSGVSPPDDAFADSDKTRDRFISSGHGQPHVGELVSPDQGNPRLQPEEDAGSEADDILSPDQDGDPVDLGTLSGYTGSQSSQCLTGSTMAVPGMRSFKVDRGRESLLLLRPPVELEASTNWPIREHAGRASSTNISTDPAVTNEGLPYGGNRKRNAQSAERTKTYGVYRADEDNEPRQPFLHGGWTSEQEWKRHLESLQEIPPSTLAVLYADPSLLRTTAEIEGRAQKQNITQFPPRAASMPRSYVDGNNRGLRQNPINTAAHPLEAEYGVYPLTRLKESKNIDYNVSDDASSVAPSDSTPQLGKKPLLKTASESNSKNQIPSSPSSSVPSRSGRSPGGNEPMPKRKAPPSLDTSGPARATVQRINPSPKEQSLLLSRTSTGSNREVRPHTAASGTSQFSQKVKGLIGRESTDSATRPPATRSSSAGSGSNGSEKRTASSSVGFAKQQSFEQLIKSDETIQYTLTPKNMRNLEMPASPKLSLRQAPENTKGIDSYSSTDPTKVESRTSTSAGRSVTSVKGTNGLRSHPIAGTTRVDSSNSQPASPARIEQPQTMLATTKGTIATTRRPATNTKHPGLINRKPGEVFPRDARAKKETTSEIADFIRSTGPESVQQHPSSDDQPGSVTPRASQARSRTQQGNSIDHSHPRKVSKPRPVQAARSAGTASSKKPGSKLQARDATVAHDNQTSDLIDFIRQGPALDRSDGSRRIPRSVAPFRRTMDSDEIQSLGNGKAKDASSVTSTQDGLAPSQSLRSSSNSRTSLLDSAKRRNNGQHVNTSHQSGDETPRPFRKQRRVRDPYPIDIEDEDESGLNQGPPVHEETLVEFLRSMSPPRKAQTGSNLDRVPDPNKKTVAKKGSGQNIREQFARATASVHSPKASGSTQAVVDIAGMKGTRGREGPRQTSPLTPREMSPHLVTQNGTKIVSYKPTHLAYAAHVDRDRNASNRVRPQPRGEREAEPGLSDLADFLKNSGPPTPPMESSFVPGKERDEGGFSRLFRRKKSTTRL